MSENRSYLFHDLKVEHIVCIPDSGVVQLAVLRSEPVSESSENAVALSHEAGFLLNIFVCNKFHITLHCVIILFQDIDVSILTVTFIWNGES